MAGTPSLFFDKLPQELRDNIHLLAFGSEEKTFKVIDKSSWVTREKDIRIQDPWHNKFISRGGNTDFTPYLLKPFPTCPLNKMMISRRFFEEAAASWLRGTALHFESQKQFETFVRGMRPTLIPSVGSVHLEWHDLYVLCETFANLKRCTGLHTVTVTVHNVLGVFKDKIEYIDDLNEDDFKQLSCIKDFTAVRTLNRVTLLPGTNESVASEEEKGQWHKNIVAFQEYIRSRLQVNSKHEMPPDDDDVTSAFIEQGGCIPETTVIPRSTVVPESENTTITANDTGAPVHTDAETYQSCAWERASIFISLTFSIVSLSVAIFR